MKRAFLVVGGLLVILGISQISYTFAQPLLTQGKALKLAEQYIENSLSDEAWKDNNPHISAQTPFHVDDSKVVSYIEYKVSCDSTPDCGFILVNVDKNDVAVPIASPTGNTPSELLDTGAGESDYYYFSPFDIYAENLETGFVQALDPGKSVDPREESELKLSKEEKETLKQQKQALKDELKAAKQGAKEYKKSQDFKDRKLEIQDQIFSVPKEEFSMKVLPMANADLPDNSSTYTSPGTSDTFISGANTSDCGSRVPCYQQFQTWYNPPAPLTAGYCYSGCSGTAIAILFGYYDRNGKGNLVPGTAPSAGTDSTVQSLVNSIKPLIGTTCQWNSKILKYEGSTPVANVPNAKQYAISKGYTNTTSENIPGDLSTLFSNIKTEINNNRPVILHMKNFSTNKEGHSTVVYGYKSSPSTSNIVRMNMGWGNGYVGGTTYRFSTLDQHIGAISYGGANNKKAHTITIFNIK